MNAPIDHIIERFRFSHHNIAMMLAMGMTETEITRRIGISTRRLHILMRDPTFQELIAHYRDGHLDHLKETIPDAREYIARNHVTALRQINERLEEADEPGADPIPLAILLKISADSGDRSGYSKHSTQHINVDVTFATALDRAIARSGKAKLIEGEILPPATSSARRTGEVISLPRAYRRA